MTTLMLCTVHVTYPWSLAVTQLPGAIKLVRTREGHGSVPGWTVTQGDAWQGPNWEVQ